MSQARLGARVDRTATTVRRWERGESLPTDDLLDGLAEALDIPRADLDTALAASLPDPSSGESAAEEPSAARAVVTALPGLAAAPAEPAVDDDEGEEEGAGQPVTEPAPAAVLRLTPPAEPEAPAAEPEAPASEPDREVPEPASAAPQVLVHAAESGVAAADVLDAGAEIDVVVAGDTESVGSESLPWIDVPTETILAPTALRSDGDGPAGAEPEPGPPEPTQPTAAPVPRRPAAAPQAPPAPAQLMIIDKSYIEDRWQRLLYGLRLILTVVALGVMAIILAWAAIELWDAIGAVLDLFGEQVETPEGVVES